MKGMMTVIRHDGAIIHETLGGPPSAERLQKIVGGYIEAVPRFTLYKGSRCAAFCNEDGKRMQLPTNPRAQSLWEESFGAPITTDVLVGNIVIITGDDELFKAL